ncbi:MAG: DUF1501 domain-containing protein [Gemmataceae bacterium]|nr:DUF1501 domain-containing protein [Gemmata sp.]MDW8197772.1 DUF1501 domain-containing protein [Gemmataceae bacterium]
MLHVHHHAFTFLNPQRREGLLLSRRNLLKASVAGFGGLSLPAWLQAREQHRLAPKSVILLWMTGGPSHIDTLDPKPERPVENRGPFGVTKTRLPGVLICEHLPKLAAMLDRFTVIRSVDPRGSNHEPNTVMQTGNLLAEPRTNPEASHYPAIASLVAKFRGANHPQVPPYVAFMRSRSHIAFAGVLGKQYDPFLANEAARLPVYDLVGNDTGTISGGKMFELPIDVSPHRMADRQQLLWNLDRLRADIDKSGVMAGLEKYEQQAVGMLTGGRVRDALDLAREPQRSRDRYGRHLWCQQALLARRLVEAGTAFVVLDLSYHTASGTWDTHGDNIPPYGGIKKGLGPLLPLFDHLITTLVDDLDQRGLLKQTLVIAMGEFGRTPQLGTQGSTDGRNHWPYVMSMLLAGGGLKHAQVIGSSTKDGGAIQERPVTPGDLAATIYRYFGIPLDATYTDATGRVLNLLPHGGEPLKELFS